MIRAGSIGISYVINACKNVFSSSKDDSDLSKKAKKLKILKQTLESYGGMLAKIAQMLSYDDGSDSVFSECKPFSRKKTHNFIKKYIKNNNDIPFTIVPIIYKSGSIGQVYKGEYKNEKIIVKVLYVGLDKQTEDDIKVVNMIGNFMYGNVKMKNALEEIRDKIKEELDFRIECKNHKKMYDIWNNINYATVPKVYPELCQKNMLVTKYVNGITLSEFTKLASQNEKNQLGYDLVRFMYTNIYMHKILYSDCHAGNFVITRNSEGKFVINVLDFGCLHDLNANTYKCLKKIHRSLKSEDKNKFYKYVKKIGMLHNKVTKESKEYLYQTFKRNHKPWVVEKKFTFEKKWMEEGEKKDMKLVQQWNIPREMVYFNKIPYGLFNILHSLNASNNFYEIFNSLLM